MNCAVQSADDGSIPGANDEEKRTTYKYWQSFNLDQYYSDVKHLTFPTSFIDLTIEEAKALLSFLSHPDSLSQANQSLIDNLERQINNEIAIYGKGFAKLSSRSPKDAVDKLEQKIIPLLQKQLSTRGNTSNDEFIAMRYALMECMVVHSGEELFQLFAFSSRIVSDLHRDINYSAGSWNQCLVIRQFKSIPLQGELRAFVYKGKLTGLSQYYTNCYFPSLGEEASLIEQKVHLFHKELSKCVTLASYIIDLVVHDEMEEACHKESGVTLVELNPWSDKTGSALFDWVEDESVLTSGPFEFRYLTDLPPVKVGPSWQRLIDIARPSTRASESQAKCFIS